MPQFFRSTVPSVRGGYRAFRPFVRADFARRCAYCLMSEPLAGGERNYELDHFRPRKHFPDLLNDFYNIYYSCHPCNFTKLDHWPAEQLEARGIQLVDLCKDEFARHFSAEPTGEWVGITESGKYTIDLLRLNRKHLVQLRGWLMQLGLPPHQINVGEDELNRLVDRLRATS